MMADFLFLLLDAIVELLGVLGMDKTPSYDEWRKRRRSSGDGTEPPPKDHW